MPYTVCILPGTPQSLNTLHSLSINTEYIIWCIMIPPWLPQSLQMLMSAWTLHAILNPHTNNYCNAERCNQNGLQNNEGTILNASPPDQLTIPTIGVTKHARIIQTQKAEKYDWKVMWVVKLFLIIPFFCNFWQEWLMPSLSQFREGMKKVLVMIMVMKKVWQPLIFTKPIILISPPSWEQIQLQLSPSLN